MTTAQRLQRLILAALAGGEAPSEGQLMATLLAMPGIQPRRHRKRLIVELAHLVASQKVYRVFDREIGDFRYRVVMRYRLRTTIDLLDRGVWHIDRRQPHAENHWISIMSGTEIEARACLKALEAIQ